MTDAFRTLILPAAVTPLARQIAATLSPGGIGMWTTGLSPTGAEPATHFISTGLISPEFAHIVPDQTWEEVDGAWTQTGSTPGNPEAVTEACNAAGLEVTLAQVLAVFDAADVTEQEPLTAMSRLGLSLTQAELTSPTP